MSTSTPDAAAFDAANVFGKGEPNTAYAQFFSGESFLRTLVTDPDCAVGVHNVTFAPGCRNNWRLRRCFSRCLECPCVPGSRLWLSTPINWASMTRPWCSMTRRRIV